LIWSDSLYETCVKHSNNMLINDSIYHSHGYTYSENVSYSNNDGLLITDGYSIFIKKYFNLSNEDVINNIDVFCATTIVYYWSVSSGHNKIMLSNGKYAAVHTIMKDVVKKNNIVFGQELFKGSGLYYYKLKAPSTFQIK
jgi:uncharacterized protein YkwD